MNVLLIAYHYPPDPAVGGLRAAKVASALQRAGHRVHVLAACTGDYSGEKAAADQPIVERIAVPAGPRELYARWRAARRGGAPLSGPAGIQEPGAVPQSIAAWKRYLLSFIWLPDDRQSWILPVVQRARELIRDNVDLVYTTAPPFSAHLAGLILKRTTRVRWVAEFRDPWTDNPWKPYHVRSRATDAIEEWLERRCLRAADTIVAVSDAAGDLLRRKLPARQESRVLVVRNGIEQLELLHDRGSRKSARRIVHVGTLYGKRDPRPFLRAVAELRRSGRLSAPVQVELIGNCRWYHDVSIAAVARELGLEDWIRFTDWLPHAEVAARLAEADLLLLLAQDQPAQVPNKLYEYLGTRRRILAFADADGETARMLALVGGHDIVSSTEPATVEAAVERALERAYDLEPPNEAILRSWSTVNQMQTLCERVTG